MTSNDDDYEITDEDLQAVLKYLEIENPTMATEDVAIEILQQLYQRVHTLEHIDPNAIEEILKDLENN